MKDSNKEKWEDVLQWWGMTFVSMFLLVVIVFLGSLLARIAYFGFMLLK